MVSYNPDKTCQERWGNDWDEAAKIENKNLTARLVQNVVFILLSIDIQHEF
ncbi:hypothetical protein GCM10007932_47390 [Vibrio penaeicida]|uniref:Uncharacterized protein n=1 Tax=Vibrio penaeicida TaxID=104609 RepID=A0AAV5NZA6_9VIBR|nr:hypothetical protein GCM10007932_47390 [Vibrio penaeicida]